MTEEKQAGICLPQNYIVTLIDILGQKNILDEHRFLTETTEGRALLETKGGQDKFKEIQEATYDRVLELRSNFEYALRVFSESVQNIPKVTPEERSIIEDLAKPIPYQFFSDTIIVYAPLVSENELKMRYRIASIISACTNIMLVSFARGTFFRGGIEIGAGTEFPNGEGIYGLVLNDAYYLEHKIAGYPRIVVGNKLRELIQCKERKPVYSKFCHDVNDRLDKLCNSLITKDKDGRFIIDFLGKTCADMAIKNFPKQSKDYIGRALICIGDQYTKFSNDNSENGKKISSRFELLKNYYFERLDNWGLQQTTIDFPSACT